MAAIVHILELLGLQCVDLVRIITLGGGVNCDVEVTSVYDYAQTHKSIYILQELIGKYIQSFRL